MLTQIVTKPSKQVNQVIYSGSRIVGIIRGKTLTKSIYGSRHILHKPEPSIAIDRDALDQAEQVGAVDIAVIDQESGVLYSSTIEHFRECAFEVDYGYGLQLALALAGWTRERKNGGLTQLELWGVNHG